MSDGGSAFPKPAQILYKGSDPQTYSPITELVPAHEGLTKRELFAAMAMQSLIAKLPIVDFKGEYGVQLGAEKCDEFKADVAESARGYADALLKELSKEKSE